MSGAANSPPRSTDPLRLALITPRFWPFVGDCPSHLLRLAECLQALGPEVTVVSPRWVRSWPSEVDVGPVRVVRLRGSGRGGWSTIRWMYALSRWLAQQPLDAALVAGLRHEAYVTLGAAQRHAWPAILLAEEGDIAWQRTAAFGGRIAARCLSAAAIVAHSAAQATALERAGYAAGQLCVIPRRVPIPPPASPVQRDAARAALAAANSDLTTTSSTRVALAVGRLDGAQRFGDLVRAWRIVTARHPQARLWIAGDGPDREQLYRQIGDLDQRFRILLPGTFDALDELLAAVEMVLVPAAQSSPSQILLAAQAAGLPVIAASAPGLCNPPIADNTGLTYAEGDFKALAAAVDCLLKDPAAAVRYGAAARARAQTWLAPADEAQAYAALIRGLVESKIQNPKSEIKNPS